MPKRSSKDPNVSAFSIVQQVTGEKKPVDDMTKALDDAELRKRVMREMGRRGGQKGGRARAESLSKEQRSLIAQKGARTRWNSGKK